MLQFAYNHQPTGLQSVKWSEVVGGMSTYVRELEKRLTRVQIEKGEWGIGYPNGGKHL